MKRYLILVPVFVAALVIYGLDRGIYIGSRSHIADGILRKSCRYLFVTGISELPAHGGVADQIPAGAFAQGFQLANEPDRLYCRLFQQ